MHRVKITNNRTTLRIIVRLNGDSHFIYPGLKDNYTNRLICEDIKKIILADIENNNFDYSYNSYKYQNKSVFENKNILFIDIADKYLKKKNINKSVRTIEADYYVAKEFDNFIGVRFVNKIKNKDIDSYYNYLLKSKNMKVTIKRKFNLLKNIINWGINNGSANLKYNPVESFLINQINLSNENDYRKKSYKIFNKEEISLIYNWFIDNKLIMYGNYTYFKFSTGLRPGEINALSIDDLSNNNSIISITKSFNGSKYTKTKNEVNRKFKINDLLTEFITNHINIFCNDIDLLFYKFYTNVNTSDYFYYWSKCLKELNITYAPPYNTRHTFISQQLLEGKNPVIVAKITGHKLETLLKVYARFFDDVPLI